VKKTIKQPRKLYQPTMPNPPIKTVNGVMYQWIPNPTVKAGGYWRKM
jgi:hypothetical protein